MLRSRVVLKVAVEHVDPHKPAHAATAAVAEAFEQLAPARQLLIAVAGFGEGPGVAVSPWILDGIRRAAIDYGLEAHAVDLGPADQHDAARRRLLAAGLATTDAEGRPLSIELAGARRPRRVPRSWIGRHLCLVIPCAHVQQRRGRETAWTGPLAGAFGALDRACRPPGSSADSPEAGNRLAAQAFASTTIVMDGSWWVPLQPGETSPPNVLSLDRCFAVGSHSPSEAWGDLALASFDDWLAGQLRIDGAAGGRAPSVQSRGSGTHRPWPRAPRPSHHQPRGLAGQAVEALWAAHRRRHRASAPRALPPNVPGPLARWWHDYASAAVGAGLP